ncbi:MAG TPA: type II toxin-antitoxin system VapC family toxin [Thermoanaerobaculia bacterium]|nr:type II toxin-antitoxin system VapC family toxin [Thermoanaerobaculia bacterium]
MYVETSVISYLVARRNQRDLLVASNQELTQEWWENRRASFELCVSAVVLAEAARGDQTLAAARTAVARELTLVEISESAMELANALLQRAGLPENAYEDALHIAAAATTGMDYLLTWNCKHIANAFIIPRVNRVIRSFGFEPPLICTPQELMED